MSIFRPPTDDFVPLALPSDKLGFRFEAVI